VHSFDEKEQVHCEYAPYNDKILERRRNNSQSQSIVERTIPNNDKALWNNLHTHASRMVYGESYFET
jgi:hypothetical protein